MDTKHIMSTMSTSTTFNNKMEPSKFRLPGMNHIFREADIQQPMPLHQNLQTTTNVLLSAPALPNSLPNIKSYTNNNTNNQNTLLSDHQIPTPPPHLLSQSPNKFRLPGMSQIFQHENKSNPSLPRDNIQQPMPIHHPTLLSHRPATTIPSSTTSSSQNYTYFCPPMDQQIPTPPPHYRMNSSPVLLVHQGLNTHHQLYYTTNGSPSQEQQVFYQSQRQLHSATTTQQPQQQMYQYGFPTPNSISSAPVEPIKRKKLSKQATAWTPREDKLLRHLKEVKKLGWREVSTFFNDRTPNACQFRWRRIVSGMAPNSSHTPSSATSHINSKDVAAVCKRNQSIRSLLN